MGVHYAESVFRFSGVSRIVHILPYYFVFGKPCLLQARQCRTRKTGPPNKPTSSPKKRFIISSGCEVAAAKSQAKLLPFAVNFWTTKKRRPPNKKLFCKTLVFTAVLSQLFYLPCTSAVCRSTVYRAFRPITVRRR